MQQIKFWLFLILTAVLGYYAWFNNQAVTLKSPWPLSGQVETNAFVAYLAFFGVGCLVTSLILGLSIIKLTFQVRKLKKQLKVFEDPIE